MWISEPEIVLAEDEFRSVIEQLLLVNQHFPDHAIVIRRPPYPCVFQWRGDRSNPVHRVVERGNDLVRSTDEDELFRGVRPRTETRTVPLTPTISPLEAIAFGLSKKTPVVIASRRALRRCSSSIRRI